MKTITIKLLTLLLLLSCGNEGEESPKNGKDGKNCYDKLGDINKDGKIDSRDCAGNQGPHGPVGPSGKDGQDGIDGVNGIDGKDGVKGDKGKDGTNGEDGATGPVGPQGEKGDKGDTGAPYIPPETLEGYYAFPEEGLMFLLNTKNGKLIIYNGVIHITNTDSSEGVLYLLVREPVSYTGLSATVEVTKRYRRFHNIKDHSNDIINGNRKTKYTISLDGNILTVNTIIYDTDNTTEIFNQTYESL